MEFSLFSWAPTIYLWLFQQKKLVLSRILSKPIFDLKLFFTPLLASSPTATWWNCFLTGTRKWIYAIVVDTQHSIERARNRSPTWLRPCWSKAAQIRRSSAPSPGTHLCMRRQCSATRTAWTRCCGSTQRPGRATWTARCPSNWRIASAFANSPKHWRVTGPLSR